MLKEKSPKEQNEALILPLESRTRRTSKMFLDELPQDALIVVLTHLNRVDVDTLMFAAPHVNNRWRSACTLVQAKLNWEYYDAHDETHDYVGTKKLAFVLKHLPSTVAVSYYNLFDLDIEEGTDMFEFLLPCINLRHLELRYSGGVGNTEIAFLAAHLPNLRSITLIAEPGFQHCIDFDHHLNETVKALAHLTQLTSLNIKRQYENPKSDVQHLNESLDITNETVIALVQSCTQLTHLDLSATYVDEEAITSLAMHCANLQSVRLHKCSVTNGYSQHGQSMLGWPTFTETSTTGVALFGQSCPHLRILDLSLSNATDTDIIQLVEGCTKLVHLDLSFTYVTDDSLHALGAHCKHLQWIGIEGCKHATSTAIQDLKSILPTCHFEKDRYLHGDGECEYSHACKWRDGWEEDDPRVMFDLLEEEVDKTWKNRQKVISFFDENH